RDPHEGVADLRRGVLRSVGDPHLRFEEDRLRVLRALRFAGTFGLRIEPGTWDAIRAFSDRLEKLSPERIREELWKVLSSQKSTSTSLDLYAESGVLDHLYPELAETRHQPGVDEPDGVWKYLQRSVDSVQRGRPTIRLALL